MSNVHNDTKVHTVPERHDAGCCWYDPPCQHIRLLHATSLLHRRLALIEAAQSARGQKNKTIDNPEVEEMQPDLKKNKSEL